MPSVLPDVFVMSPSDWAFLFKECQRCYRDKVLHGKKPPRPRIPALFNKMDSAQKNYFLAKPTKTIHASLPDGSVFLGDVAVRSRPIKIPGHRIPCVFRGEADAVMAFYSGGFGVIDFKSTSPHPSKAVTYSSQLHAYAIALEYPGLDMGEAMRVRRIGLVCVEPTEMIELPGEGLAYRAVSEWIEIPRDDEAFLAFIGTVLDVLESPDPPEPGPNCDWCRARMS